LVTLAVFVLCVCGGTKRRERVLDLLVRGGLLLTEDLGVSYVSAGANAMTLPKFVSHPLSMVGSDALLIGEYPSPRSYGAFPVILGEYVREEGYLSLPEAVRKMTSFPAQRLGLPDRGLLRDGFRADMVVFDPRSIQAPATRNRPKQFPVGIEHVINPYMLILLWPQRR
jgi:N-acyl-D-amino-acid deacylase